MAQGRVQHERTTKRQREQLAYPLLKIVKAAFEDPKIREEFKQWQNNRNMKGEKNVSRPYITCPDCGSNLDPGEICDCKHSKASAPEAGSDAGQQATGNPYPPVLAPGA